MTNNFTPERIGINFEAFTNPSFPEYNLTNMSVESFINGIPERANELTGDLLGFITLFTLLFLLIWLFSDISQLGFYRYSTLRAIALALGIVTTFGIILVSIGFIYDVRVVFWLGGLYMLFLIWIIINNPS